MTKEHVFRRSRRGSRRHELRKLALAMRDHRSSPLPAYAPPLDGHDRPRPRFFVVDTGLIETGSADRNEEGDSAHDGDRAALIPNLGGIDTARLSPPAAANDQGVHFVSLLIFVGDSPASTSALRRASRAVERIGADRATLRVVRVGEGALPADVVDEHVTFTPTLILETNGTRSRIVGAPEMQDLAQLLPDYAGLLCPE